MSVYVFSKLKTILYLSRLFSTPMETESSHTTSDYLDADAYFPRYIESVLGALDSSVAKEPNSSLEDILPISRQWDTALKLILERKRKNQVVQNESVNDLSAKRAKLLRLVSKSRRDISFNKQEEDNMWFLKRRSAMKVSDWKIMREDFGIQVSLTDPKNALQRERSRPAPDDAVPSPIRCWEEADMPCEVVAILKETFNIIRPSPIQMQAFPIVRTGLDIVARAETGSGKSIAFILPSLLQVSKIEPSDSPPIIFVAPTQELSKQLFSVAAPFIDKLGLQCITAMGGDLIQSNASAIRRGVHCIIGTPGRIMDLLEGKFIALTQTRIIAVDEADRCTDSGLIVPMKYILNHAKEVSSPQLLFFSATYGKSLGFIEGIVRPNSLIVRIGGLTNKNIRQLVEFKTANKNETLTRLTQQYIDRYSSPIIIFCNSREACEALNARLDAQDISSAVLHAGLSTQARGTIFSAFQEKSVPILITTDALARGIDIADVSLVVNFEAPHGDDALEKYVHRIGRTGRAGKSGTAVTFLEKKDTAFIRTLRSYLKECDQSVPKEIDRMCQIDIESKGL